MATESYDWDGQISGDWHAANLAKAVAAERERIAKFVENMSDGPITTRAVKSYLAAEIRASAVKNG